MSFAPTLSPLQLSIAKKNKDIYKAVPKICVVTGGTGFVGMRLVEMLVERGAKKVISFDIVPPPDNAWKHPNIEWRVGDITNMKEVEDVMGYTHSETKEKVECVWHNAAAVGPFHPKALYYKVNYQGTLNIMNACKKYNINKIVMSSSPSTRFTGADVDGLREDEMPELPLPKYLQPYAETKAMGEIELLKANNAPSLMTIAVAPHQVYGPRDNLFLPNILEAAGNGKLRVFGEGYNRICFTHVDNYCHGLIIAADTLKENSPTLGKFYIVTDGKTHPNGEQYLVFWKEIDAAIVGMGFQSLWSKMHLPKWLLYGLAYICEFVGYLMNTTFKLNYFNVLVLTMHRWFDIQNAEKDLNFQPIIGYDEGWKDTIVWFRENWLPTFNKTKSLIGISTKTQEKIDIQDHKDKKNL